MAPAMVGVGEARVREASARRPSGAGWLAALPQSEACV